MQITLLQAVIIGLWTAFCYSGMLWGIFTNRALVLSFGVGIVCGDLKTALQCGAIAELAFMGFGVGAGLVPVELFLQTQSDLVSLVH